jgi:CO/xanthine dehydrogenase FAD-binding subunit
VAVTGVLDGPICRQIRLVVGAVGAVPVVVEAASDWAPGNNLPGDLTESIAAEAARVIEPIDDQQGSGDYKRKVVRTLVRRSIAALLEKAR